MTFSPKDFFAFFKLPPNILFAISFTTGLILFLPEDILSKMYLINFRNKFGFIIGILFFLSVSILIVFILSYIIEKIKNKIKTHKYKKRRIEYLLRIDKSKTNLIKEFIKNETHTLSLPMNNGSVLELEYLKIISTAGNTQLANYDYDDVYLKYFLQPWVLDLIINNDELKKKFKI